VWADKPVVLFLVGEAEYGTRQTLPEFAEKELERYDCRFVFAKSDDRKDPNVHVFPGLKAALDEADLLFLSVRRRYPSVADMKEIRYWFHDGKPLVGIRTASHPFGERGKAPYLAGDGQVSWNTFDRDILGASYTGHYNAKDGHATVNVAKKDHRILAGVEGGFNVSSHLYKNGDLDATTEVLLTGHVEDKSEPIAWTREKDGQRIFYTSLGGVEDMGIPAVRKMLVNAIGWALDEDPEINVIPQDDLEVEILAQHPVVAQPSFLNFDERGRVWVVQYRQYPEPAGLNLVSKDRFWRAVYDKVPAPPGHPKFVPGKDRITIHEDVDGDGSYESVKTFSDGLNLVTSCVRGHGGVYVLQPPYLLFYADENDDDIPDGDPEVLLEGFGIEDTHSICSSLCWGPDGWLYASQGSTVTGAVKVPGSEAEPVRSVGQLMWRYHPGRKHYEIFAEGGGNIWSCEFDAKGRLFAGSNGGAPGFFYLQGAYYNKNFGKHGALSNPYAFGYFDGIDHPGFKRVSTNLIIYEGGALPARYNGSLIACNPVLRQFRASTIEEKGLGYAGRYLDELVSPQDNLFRPVYADFGPDGALYICDWVDTQVNHYRNHEGRIRKQDGKLLRLRAKGAPNQEPFDLRRETTDELVSLLTHKNRWWRETARRLLMDRSDRGTAIPRLRGMLAGSDGPLALEALWALNLCGGYEQGDGLSHSDPTVRQWAIRLMSDKGLPVSVGAGDPSLAVRGQLASAAKVGDSVSMDTLAQLMKQEADCADAHQPLLVWWAFERMAQNWEVGDADDFLDAHGTAPMFMQHVGPNYVRKLARQSTVRGLEIAAKLLAHGGRAWGDVFLENYQGDSVAALPLALVEQLLAFNPGDLVLRVRLGKPGAVADALATMKKGAVSSEQLPDLFQALVAAAPSDPVFDALEPYIGHENEAVRIASYQAFQQKENDVAATAWMLLDGYKRVREGREKDVLQAVLASRVEWGRKLMSLTRDLLDFPPDIVLVLRGHADTEIDAALDGVEETNASATGEHARLRAILSQAGGDMQSGRKLFMQRCGTCHYLHNEGGNMGPDLTPYQRGVQEDLLLAILQPSAEIREGFSLVSVHLHDQQVLSGFLVEETPRVLSLRQFTGGTVMLKQAEVARIVPSGVSMMPPGLLNGLKDDEIRNLFSYLSSSQPLNVKK
jgi:putative membrane-bound dehydrogenase-like protein